MSQDKVDEYLVEDAVHKVTQEAQTNLSNVTKLKLKLKPMSLNKRQEYQLNSMIRYVKTKPRKEHKLPNYDYPEKKVKGLDRQSHPTNDSELQMLTEKQQQQIHFDLDSLPDPPESALRKAKPIKFSKSDHVYGLLSTCKEYHKYGTRSVSGMNIN